MTDSCRALWLAVLNQGRKDAAGIGAAGDGLSPRKLAERVALERRRVLAWLLTPSFEEVCSYAGVDPAAASEIILRAASDGEETPGRRGPGSVPGVQVKYRGNRFLGPELHGWYWRRTRGGDQRWVGRGGPRGEPFPAADDAREAARKALKGPPR